MADPKCMKPTEALNTDVNVLLLGESGVGKSTFINAFVNYLQYDKLEKAVDSNSLFCLIPTKFTVHTNEEDAIVEKVIRIGQSDNEDQEVGNSSTQGTKAYVFPINGNKRLRLIDTPGIGDARGLEQDNFNFENILSYISQFNQLHGICFLLKPTHTVLTAYFKFCILHLLSRLDKSASNNIMFIFTNSRATFYKPGDTLSILRRLLLEIKESPPYVEIPCDKDNIFCFDNEAFRYLAAIKEGVKFSDAEKTHFGESWDRSVKTCWELVERISGGNGQKGLTGHDITNTLSINEARRVIINLSKPLADISDVVEDNLMILRRHEKEINQENMTLSDLRDKLYIPAINIKQTSLSQPIMVCTSTKCSEVHTVSGMIKYHYKEACDKPCMCSQNLQTALIGSPDLLSCRMFGSTKSCKKCGCDFSTHMRILYETEMVFDRLEDATVKSEINTVEEAIEAQKSIIEKIKDRINEYDHEKTVISKSLTKFAHFLKQNSISTRNDAYGDYIDYLIERENSMGSQKDKFLIARYQCLKKQHEEEKLILEDIENSASAQTEDSILSAKSVNNCVLKLYNLKHSGKKIRELHKKQEKVRQKDHMEYCHPSGVKPKKKKAKSSKSNIADLLKNLKLDNKEALLEQLIKECSTSKGDVAENSDNEINVEQCDKNKFVPSKGKKDYNKKMDNKNKNHQIKNKERQLKNASRQSLNDFENENLSNMPGKVSNQGSIPNLLDKKIFPPNNIPNQFGNGQFNPPDQFSNPHQFRMNPNQFANNMNQFGNYPNQFGNNPTGNNQNQFGNNPNQFQNNPNQFVNSPNQFGNNQNRFGPNPNQFANNQNQFGNASNPFNPNLYNMPNQFVNAPTQIPNIPFGTNPNQFSGNQNQFNKKPNQIRNQPNSDFNRQFSNSSAQHDTTSDWEFVKNPNQPPNKSKNFDNKNNKPLNMKLGSNPNLKPVNNPKTKQNVQKNIAPKDADKTQSHKTNKGSGDQKPSSGTIPKASAANPIKKQKGNKKGVENKAVKKPEGKKPDLQNELLKHVEMLGKNPDVHDQILKTMEKFAKDQLQLKKKKDEGQTSFVVVYHNNKN